MHPRDLSIKDYTYHLPPERIASHPLNERDASRLLIYKEGHISDDVYMNIARHLPEGALLLFNNTRVVEARLLFQKQSGGTIEIFCLEPHEKYRDITSAMQETGSVQWQCLVGGASKWKRGQILKKEIIRNNSTISLQAGYIEKRTDSFIIELSWTPSHLSFAELLHTAGAIPLPPYIKRMPNQTDVERYQTIFAKPEGSVAAPTAGLHFTHDVFKSLQEKNIHHEFLTLHVGAGTFKPVKAERMSGHDMHGEFIEVSAELIKSIIAHLEHTIIAVGTTSLRTLESLYWLGIQATRGFAPGDMFVSQWEPYEQSNKEVPAKIALKALLQWMEENEQGKILARTKILIAPGYSPRIARALITNFHQPESTLLLLVAAVTGKDWRKIYDHALANDYRFLSYGDGCLIWFNNF